MPESSSSNMNASPLYSPTSFRKDNDFKFRSMAGKQFQIGNNTTNKIEESKSDDVSKESSGVHLVS